MNKTKNFPKKFEKSTGNERTGLLVAHFGQSADVLDTEGNIIHCHLRKNREPVVTGDQVLWEGDNNSGIILNYLPRKSLLARHERNGKMRPLAANIDAIIIVTAPPPALSEYLIDRYLIASHHINVTPIILLNKMDLLDATNLATVKEQLAIYEQIGYQVIYSSTVTEDGLIPLSQFLQNKSCVLAGVSGVGKSSIIATLCPDLTIKIGATSPRGAGKHTTTITRLYNLPEGGSLIDSPGVREFGLWHMDREEILQGFIEFKQFVNQCKFRDCKHIKEPGCAVAAAAHAGKISSRRLESYRKLVAES